MDVKELALKLAENPNDPQINFDLASAYEEQLQYASAAGFYFTSR